MTRIRFNIKRPKNKRKSWSIYRDVIASSGRTQTLVKDKRIEQLNRTFQEGGDFEFCNKLAEEIRATLYKEANLKLKRVFNKSNETLLNKFFKERYEFKRVKDKESAYNMYRRSIEVVGEESLEAIAQRDLIKRLSSLPTNKQRIVASSLTQIFKWMGRDDLILHREKKVRSFQVKHLTEAELEKVLISIENPALLALYRMLFSSGLRVGEAFALDSSDYQQGVILVNKQMLRTWDMLKRGLSNPITETKSGRLRRVVPFKAFNKYFKQWLRIPLDERVALRNRKLGEPLKQTCIKLFPNNPNKHCSIHDLRHSFAIQLLSGSRGVNLSIVAQQLGNSVNVCQEYYTGFSLNDESIEFLKSRLGTA